MILFKLLALITLVKIVHTGGSHSLWFFVTVTSGPSPFPEMVIVEMVDDFPVGYYDSAEKRMVAWKNWEKEETDLQYAEIRKYAIDPFTDRMKQRLHLLREHYNHSGGLLTVQRLAGCELDADGTERFKRVDAYNGEDIFKFDSESVGWYSLIPEIEEHFSQDTSENFFTQTFSPYLCTSLLKSHLQQLNNLLNRKVHPRVRVIHKQDRDTGGMEVTCLASGFYPRHINMTLKKNSQPVPDQELSTGEPLPNGDGTYQLRRSLSVSAEELRERHLYTCTVTHSSVDNKLDVSWEFHPARNNLVPLGVSFGVLTALVLTILGLCIWKKRGADVQHTAVGEWNDESSGASELLQTSLEVSKASQEQHNVRPMGVP
ncbi:major histocompatibility complex class I-related gene protein-like [Megalops cyprinoides]|uniref:major histocompatibility complex class I-related gene protein-like n=1 Tax=Megalops cyprinoides TaxID=118141 RepID=UPI0018649AC0|nr:major histocompatibility complex class I-related gene protein-like [Megalops cyprinoides]